jgi:hypothetical protein
VPVAKPLIVDEFIPAEGSTEKPWRKESVGDAREGKAFVADARQMAAAQAAQVAMNQGKSKAEIHAAAKDAYESAVVAPAPTEFSAEDDMKIRWLRAICRLGSGKFSDCSPRDLLDVAMLVETPVIPFDQWVKGF